MGENKTQVIIHKSNWASQMLYMVLGLIVIFSFYMKNPTEKDFMKALVKKVSVESGNSNGLSESISKIVSDLGNDIITLPVERNDYLFFSTYSLTTDQIQVTGFGIIGKVYIVSFELDTKGFYKYKNFAGWNELPKDAKDFWVTQMEKPGTDITVSDILSFKINDNQDKVYVSLTEDNFVQMIKLPTGWKFEIVKNEEVQNNKNDDSLNETEKINGSFYSNDTKGFIDFLYQEEKINNLNTSLIYQNNNIYSYGKDGIFNYKYENGTFVSY